MAERSGCATALVAVGGLILTLPGLCLFFAFGSVMERYVRPYQTLIVWAAVIGLIGIVGYLIYDFSRDPPRGPN
ncbi:MAG: mercuric transport protein [Alphaproteobacteria bacterium]|nr:MAG: mercuric transport protein [Alphaproteobacteria bacterium]